MLLNEESVLLETVTERQIHLYCLVVWQRKKITKMENLRRETLCCIKHAITIQTTSSIKIDARVKNSLKPYHAEVHSNYSTAPKLLHQFKCLSFLTFYCTMKLWILFSGKDLCVTRNFSHQVEWNWKGFSLRRDFVRSGLPLVWMTNYPIRFNSKVFFSVYSPMTHQFTSRIFCFNLGVVWIRISEASAEY